MKPLTELEEQLVGPEGERRRTEVLATLADLHARLRASVTTPTLGRKDFGQAEGFLLAVEAAQQVITKMPRSTPSRAART